MKVVLRIPEAFYVQAMSDLERPHPFAAERIGFFSTSIMQSGKGRNSVVVRGYTSLSDDRYIDDHQSGARIDRIAIRESLQRILDENSGQLHVHIHSHRGPPEPSSMDQRELPRLAKSFVAADCAQAHGGLILSQDSAHACLWLPGSRRPIVADSVVVIGAPIKFLV